MTEPHLLQEQPSRARKADKGNGAAPSNTPELSGNPQAADDLEAAVSISGDGSDTIGQTSDARAERIKDLEDAVLADGEDTNVPDLITTVIPVGKPGDFFRVHPGEDQSCVLTGLQSKDMNKTFYVVAQSMRGYLADYLRRYLIIRCIDMNGEEFLWPIALPSVGDEPNKWTLSSLKAMETAKGRWIKLVYIGGAEGYKLEPALGDPPQPNWLARSFPELRTLALADFVIADTDHPQAIKLREGKRRQ
jgi:hypothetical protein